MKRITVNDAKRLAQPGMYRADPTLYLHVSEGLTKSWVQRLLIDGKRRDIGLGSFPAVSIVAARALAMQNQAALSMDADPLADRLAARKERKRRASMPTFAETNDTVYKNKVMAWRSPVAARNWRQSMNRYVLSRIGDKPIDEICREDVRSILTPIWTVKPAVSRKLRQRMSAVFEHAAANGHISLNPAGEVINGALIRQKAVKAHFGALPYQEPPETLDTIQASSSPARSFWPGDNMTETKRVDLIAEAEKLIPAVCEDYRRAGLPEPEGGINGGFVLALALHNIREVLTGKVISVPAVVDARTVGLVSAIAEAERAGGARMSEQAPDLH